MGLTGTLFAWLLYAAAAALFIWVVASWPKAARPGLRGITRRAVSLVAIVGISVAAMGVTLNDQYDWYTSWDDLAGSFTAAAPAQSVEHAGAAPSAAAAAPLAPYPSGGTGGQGVPGMQGRGVVVLPAERTDLDLKPHPGPDGQYHRYIVGGPSGVRTLVLVWFPQSYTDPAQRSRRYPVIEAFHGIPGSPAQLAYNPNLGDDVTAAAAAGRIRDAVVVMPFMEPGHLDTECVNGGPGEPQMETWLTQDVPDWVRTNIRVQEGRDSWATWGFSAGGYCAALVTMLHPETFSAAVVLGGYFHPLFDPPYVPFLPGSHAWHRYDLVTLAETNPPPVALWVQTSVGDPLSYPTSRALLAHARAPLSITVDDMARGGHRMSVWLPLIPRTLAWLGSSLPGFAPPHQAPATASGPTRAAPSHPVTHRAA